VECGNVADSQHVAETLALEDLASLRAHGSELGVGRDYLVQEGRVGHHLGHLLQEAWTVE
jgi:hypothetical protein